jgi:hypothetical protein
MDRMTSLLDAGVYVHAAYAAKFGVTLEDKYDDHSFDKANQI